MKLSRIVCIAPALLLAACAENPQKAAQHLQKTEPNAIKTVAERAKLDLGCDKIDTTVTERQAGETRTAGLNRSVFKIAARGCARAQHYSVACSDVGDCSAMMEAGLPVQ